MGILTIDWLTNAFKVSSEIIAVGLALFIHIKDHQSNTREAWFRLRKKKGFLMLLEP